MRCTDGIRISHEEYTHILAELRSRPGDAVRRVLTQPKALPWFEEITYTACLFHDITTRLCVVTRRARSSAISLAA